MNTLQVANEVSWERYNAPYLSLSPFYKAQIIKIVAGTVRFFRRN